MRFSVTPDPAGGYHVRVEGNGAPLSHHPTEEAAQDAVAAYRGGTQEQDGGERVRLRDGREVLLRPVRPQDKPLFAAGWERFGDDSRYARFMSAKKRLSVRDLAFFTELDHVDHEAIGAIDPASGEGLGVARYVRHADRPHAAEAAVAVIDAMQGAGLGTALLRQLCLRASENGISCFTASLFTGNRDMLTLFRKLGKVTITDRVGAETDVDVELQVSDSPTLGLLLRSAASGVLKVRDAWH